MVSSSLITEYLATHITAGDDEHGRLIFNSAPVYLKEQPDIVILQSQASPFDGSARRLRFTTRLTGHARGNSGFNVRMCGCALGQMSSTCCILVHSITLANSNGKVQVQTSHHPSILKFPSVLSAALKSRWWGGVVDSEIPDEDYRRQQVTTADERLERQRFTIRERYYNPTKMDYDCGAGFQLSWIKAPGPPGSVILAHACRSWGFTVVALRTTWNAASC
ncbi:hypothetical protein CBL_14436 [Carabus blaptoides fortunei]